MVFRCIALLSALFSILVTALTGGFAAASFWWMLPAWFVCGFAGLTLLAFLLFALICGAIDVEKPQEHDSKFHRTVVNLAVDALISLCRVRIHPQGLEKTPESGRFLLVCNHLDLPDPGILLHCFKDSQLAFVSKRENQAMPFIGRLMHKIMCQLINRENDREALKTILKCIQLLKDDEVSVAVFPEGYCSQDGKLHHFRSGVLKIAQRTGVPIVVCTLQNTNQLFKNLLKLKPTDVPLHLVKVIAPEEYRGMSTTQMGDMIYELMIGDLGEAFRADDA